MKISEAIRATIASGLYLGTEEVDKSPRAGGVFFCHALDLASLRGFIPKETKSAAQDAISSAICGYTTLAVYLRNSDKGYATVYEKYGHWHRHCFKRRVKWLQALAAKLEADGK